MGLPVEGVAAGRLVVDQRRDRCDGHPVEGLSSGVGFRAGVCVGVCVAVGVGQVTGGKVAP